MSDRMKECTSERVHAQTCTNACKYECMQGPAGAPRQYGPICDIEVFVSACDVDDCFYKFRVPEVASCFGIKQR
eukprot:11161989-Lingulodinium_polyedra.AAC.1